jgi:hypothetical protein
MLGTSVVASCQASCDDSVLCGYVFWGLKHLLNTDTVFVCDIELAQSWFGGFGAAARGSREMGAASCLVCEATFHAFRASQAIDRMVAQYCMD